MEALLLKYWVPYALMIFIDVASCIHSQIVSVDEDTARVMLRLSINGQVCGGANTVNQWSGMW